MIGNGNHIGDDERRKLAAYLAGLEQKKPTIRELAQRCLDRNREAEERGRPVTPQDLADADFLRSCGIAP